MQKNWIISLLVGFALVSISGCNWNRTEKAQQQNYATGSDAPSAMVNTLQRQQGYYKKSDGDLLSKMR